MVYFVPCHLPLDIMTTGVAHAIDIPVHSAKSGKEVILVTHVAHAHFLTSDAGTESFFGR